MNTIQFANPSITGTYTFSFGVPNIVLGNSDVTEYFVWSGPVSPNFYSTSVVWTGVISPTITNVKATVTYEWGTSTPVAVVSTSMSLPWNLPYSHTKDHASRDDHIHQISESISEINIVTQAPRTPGPVLLSA